MKIDFNKIVPITVLSLLFVVSVAHAEDVSVGNVSLSPAKVEVSINPGETKTVTLTVSSNTNSDVSAIISVEDFLPSDSDELVKFVGDNGGQYSASNLINIGIKNFSLASGETIQVPVTISVPLSYPNGGRYAAVFVTMIGNPSSASSGANLRSRLGSLFFIKVGSHFNESGELSKFGLVNNENILWDGDASFYATYNNDGDAHLNPYGGITILNMFGKNVSFSEIKPWFVLPKSIRTRVLGVDSVGWKFGKYSAKIELNRGYDDVVDTQIVSFWIVSWKTLTLLSAFIVGIMCALYYSFRKKV